MDHHNQTNLYPGLCVLLCIPAFFLQKSKQTLNQMFQMEEKKYTEIKIITSKTALSSLDELASHRVGFKKEAI